MSFFALLFFDHDLSTHLMSPTQNQENTEVLKGFATENAVILTNTSTEKRYIN